MCIVLDYTAEVRDLRDISMCESVKNGAMGYFLDVHRYAPKLAIVGDMGWKLRGSLEDQL